MKEITYIDIFSCPQGNSEAMTVTTNGMIKSNGRAVMGAGIAKAVDQRFDVGYKLAQHLRLNGNVPADLGTYLNGFHILSFPTKNDWRDNSDISLIVQSSKMLVTLADQLGLTKIYTVRPGCANGHLSWDNQVKPAIENILDDRFIVISPYGR